MARKDIEKEQAFIDFVENGMSQKAIAQKINVTEKTLSKWANSGNPSWKELRAAKLSNPDTLLSKLKLLMQGLVEKQVQEEAEGNISYETINQIAIIGKRIDAEQSKSKPSLRVYLQSIDRFLKAIQDINPEIYFKLLPIYKKHLISLND